MAVGDMSVDKHSKWLGFVKKQCVLNKLEGIRSMDWKQGARGRVVYIDQG